MQHTFLKRTNAQVYAPEQLIRALDGIACTPELVLVVDVDALERSERARVERVMMMSLVALAHAGVQIVLVAHVEVERAALLQRSIEGARFLPDVTSFAQVRKAVAATTLIGVTDDPDLLATLRDDDRGIALGCEVGDDAQTVTTTDVSLRAALWWLADVRANTSASLH